MSKFIELRSSGRRIFVNPARVNYIWENDGDHLAGICFDNDCSYKLDETYDQVKSKLIKFLNADHRKQRGRTAPNRALEDDLK